MTQTGQYLIQNTRINWLDKPVDYTETLLERWYDRQGGQAMLPSPGVVMYDVRANYTAVDNPDGVGQIPAIRYEADVVPQPFMHDLVRRLEPWQQRHRSRSVVIASSALLPNELRHKVHVIDELQPYLREARMPDGISRVVRDIKIDKTLKYMHLDMQWIREYIKSHEQRSMGQRRKWSAAYEVQREEWEEIQNNIKDGLERLRATPIPVYNDILFNTGIRGRTGNFADGITWQIVEYITRTRLITFHPAESTWTLFIPQKAAWYTEYFKELEKEFRVAGEYQYPYVEGGKIYVNFANDIVDNNFYALDGRTFDGSVGIINGKYNEAFMIRLRGMPMEPTGVSTTSMDDTTANMWLTRHVDAKKYILGDDLNVFTKRDIGQQLGDLKVFEFQPEDTEDHYFLGVALRQTQEERRKGLLNAKIEGIKVTADSPKHGRPLALNGPEIATGTYIRKMDNRARAAWWSAYFGRYGAGTLLSRLSKIPPGEILAPAETLENILAGVLVEEVDVFALAEELGTVAYFQ